MEPLSPEREALLLARLRAQATREAAFAELLRALHRPLWALCRHLCGNEGDAEDVLQESLLGLYQAIPAFRGEARLSTLAHRIALRAALRHRSKRPRASVAIDHAEQVPHGAAALDEQAAARQGAVRMLAAMEKLSADDRAVLALFAIEGLAHKEIAEILALPEGTVWYRLHRARKALKELAGA